MRQYLRRKELQAGFMGSKAVLLVKDSHVSISHPEEPKWILVL
jgi:hypothetical protein